MKKCENIIQEEKRKALFAAYKQARKKLYEQDAEPGRIHQLAIKKALETPQKRFWISPYRAYRILISSIHGGKSIKTWKTRQGLYKEMIDTYHKLKDKRMFRGKPLIFIASFMVYEPSQGFYMSASRAGRMISEEFRKRRTHQ